MDKDNTLESEYKIQCGIDGLKGARIFSGEETFHGKLSKHKNPWRLL